MNLFYIIVNLSENKDQKTGVDFLLAELIESKHMSQVMAALSKGMKPKGDTFVFRLGSSMANQVIACSKTDELLELDLSDFRTQQNGLDGNKSLHVYLK